MNGLTWVGIFADEKIIPRGTHWILCATLEKKMQFKEGERDFVMLQHKFEVENKDDSKETRTPPTLIKYGDPKGYSVMARLVGVPCGVTVKKVLDGTVSEKGILAPMSSRIHQWLS
jgi:saccharopine dehydrogenase (NADP+, L-glutamate forming)